MQNQTPHDFLRNALYLSSNYDGVFNIILQGDTTYGFTLERYDSRTGEPFPINKDNPLYFPFNDFFREPFHIAYKAELVRIPLESSLGKIIQERSLVKLQRVVHQIDPALFDS